MAKDGGEKERLLTYRQSLNEDCFAVPSLLLPWGWDGSICTPQCIEWVDRGDGNGALECYGLKFLEWLKRIKFGLKSCGSSLWVSFCKSQPFTTSLEVVTDQCVSWIMGLKPRVVQSIRYQLQRTSLPPANFPYTTFLHVKLANVLRHYISS